MKKIIVYPILLLIFIWGTGILAADDKDYSITNVQIDAELSSDGSMQVSESRTFYFDGKYSYLFRYFPLNGPVKFTDFSVFEGRRKYRESNSGDPGTFLVKEEKNRIVIKWFISARNEFRTFKLSYNVEGAVKTYDDAAVLYYQFISPDWGKSQFDVRVNITPPEMLNRYQIEHWLHGPLWGESRLEYDGTIVALCERVPRKTYFEIRALYPLETFSAAPKFSGYVRQDILTEESIWADEANLRRQEAVRKHHLKIARYKTGSWLMPLIAILLLILWIILFKKYWKRPKVERSADILAEPPEKIPPALIGYLLNSRTVTGPCIIATIMDLGVRNYVKFNHKEIEKRPGKYKHEYSFQLDRELFENDMPNLQKFEIELLNFLFNDISRGEDSINIKILKKHHHKFMKFFNKWKKNISKSGKEMDWFDRNSVKAGNYSLVFSILSLFLAIASVFWFGIWAAVPGIISLVIMILSAIIPHHTYIGKVTANEWKAFRKYLKKYHFRDEVDNEILEKISDMFVFGALFDINKKIFQELGSIIPQENYRRYVPWYVMHSNRQTSFTPKAFGTAISTMISTTGSTMSSASGAGGGASSGGGGGAGSGGGGAG